MRTLLLALLLAPLAQAAPAPLPRPARVRPAAPAGAAAPALYRHYRWREDDGVYFYLAAGGRAAFFLPDGGGWVDGRWSLEGGRYEVGPLDGAGGQPWRYCFGAETWRDALTER